MKKQLLLASLCSLSTCSVFLAYRGFDELDRKKMLKQMEQMDELARSAFADMPEYPVSDPMPATEPADQPATSQTVDQQENSAEPTQAEPTQEVIAPKQNGIVDLKFSALFPGQEESSREEKLERARAEIASRVAQFDLEPEPTKEFLLYLKPFFKSIGIISLAKNINTLKDRLEKGPKMSFYERKQLENEFETNIKTLRNPGLRAVYTDASQAKMLNLFSAFMDTVSEEIPAFKAVKEDASPYNDLQLCQKINAFMATHSFGLRFQDKIGYMKKPSLERQILKLVDGHKHPSHLVNKTKLLCFSILSEVNNKKTEMLKFSLSFDKNPAFQNQIKQELETAQIEKANLDLATELNILYVLRLCEFSENLFSNPEDDIAPILNRLNSFSEHFGEFCICI